MTSPTARVRGVFLFQLAASTTRPVAQTWVNTYVASLVKQEPNAVLRDAVIGTKGGVVLEIWAVNPVATVAKVKTALGSSVPAATQL
jgi:hypothetical protein